MTNPIITETTRNTEQLSKGSGQVPFLDLRAAYEELKEEIDEAVARVLGSGYYLLGKEVEALEEEFAEYLDVKYCVGVGNGLDALHLALRALGVGQGDEVLVPAIPTSPRGSRSVTPVPCRCLSSQTRGLTI